MTLEERLSEIIKAKGVNLAEAARSIGIPYGALYDSLKNKSKNREIKGKELVKLCRFLDVDPMNLDFADEPGTGAQEGR